MRTDLKVSLLKTDEEIEECIKNLENDTPKKQAKPKRTAPKKKDVTKVKKTEIKIEKTEETKPIEEKKEAKKNKLPSWLL